MPTQKHALVVDDSKSARLVLRRMLEKHGLAVDTSNSAGEALEFLIHNRPDVIFMDHMMPGMDGFEAVKAIKNNPATAIIPILMYTSKGGDLYLGQARALGAVGILPKTVAPAELFGSLERLGLVQDRRSKDRSTDGEQASERAHDIERRTSEHVPFLDPEMPVNTRPDPPDERDTRIRKLLEEQRVELRKDILVSMESVSRHVGEKFERDLEEKLETFIQPQTPAPATSIVPGILLSILLFLSLGWNYSLHQDFKAAQNKSQLNEQQAALQTSLPAVQDSVEVANNEVEETASVDQAVIDWAMNQFMPYPFDEIALDKERVDTVENILERLAGSGFEGNVILETHTGEFCLLGNEDAGFKLPPPEATVDQCDFIGNPVQPADTPATQQSLQFANFYNSTPYLADGSPVTLEVVATQRSEPLVDYPLRSEETTAQAWNQAAEKNNQVIVRLFKRGRID